MAGGSFLGFEDSITGGYTLNLMYLWVALLLLMAK